MLSDRVGTGVDSGAQHGVLPLKPGHGMALMLVTDMTPLPQYADGFPHHVEQAVQRASSGVGPNVDDSGAPLRMPLPVPTAQQIKLNSCHRQRMRDHNNSIIMDEYGVEMKASQRKGESSSLSTASICFTSLVPPSSACLQSLCTLVRVSKFDAAVLSTHLTWHSVSSC